MQINYGENGDCIALHCIAYNINPKSSARVHVSEIGQLMRTDVFISLFSIANQESFSRIRSESHSITLHYVVLFNVNEWIEYSMLFLELIFSYHDKQVQISECFRHRIAKRSFMYSLIHCVAFHESFSIFLC